MCIDWEQLYTRNRHQNADLQKVEQAVVKSATSGQYGFVDAAQERLRRLARAFVSPRELSPHSTLAHKAALRRAERREKDWTTSLKQPLPEHKHSVTKHTQTAPARPLPATVCYEGKAFTKRGQGQDSPL